MFWSYTQPRFCYLVAETTTEDTDDGWGDDDDDDFWGDDGGWGDDDDDPWGESSGSLLPPCESLFADEAIPGENCDNTTIVPPEIRLNDPIYERLIAQVWSDFQYKLNQEAQLYGVQLDPFDVDAKLPEPIDLQQQGTGYSADVQMHGIKVGNFQSSSRRGKVLALICILDVWIIRNLLGKGGGDPIWKFDRYANQCGFWF